MLQHGNGLDVLLKAINLVAFFIPFFATTGSALN